MAQVTPDCGLASEIPLPRLLGKPTEYRDVLVVFYTCFAVVYFFVGIQTPVAGWGWEIAGSRRAGFIWILVRLALDGYAHSTRWKQDKA